MSPVVILVGPPGAGKTTVARAVADNLGLTMRDTDADIEAATGMTVADIFVRQGEEHFRALETAAVAAAVAEHDGVVALGGGAVTAAATRDVLRPHRVVFLDVGLASATRRSGMSANRPLLLGNVRATLKRLMDERRALYLEVATHTIDTDDLDSDGVAGRVIKLIGDNA